MTVILVPKASAQSHIEICERNPGVRARGDRGVLGLGHQNPGMLRGKVTETQPTPSYKEKDIVGSWDKEGQIEWEVHHGGFPPIPASLPHHLQ